MKVRTCATGRPPPHDGAGEAHGPELNILDRIFGEAKRSPGHVVLAEGGDGRVQAAAAEAVRRGIADITLLCGPDSAGELRSRFGRESGISVVVPDEGAVEEFAETYETLRRHKGVDREAALKAMGDPLGYAAMMVRSGLADGTIAGAVATTADTIRAALSIIGRTPDTRIVSSFFLMVPGSPQPFPRTVIFADCALVVDPGPQDLADIAVQSAGSARRLLGEEPRVAMLSFSTKGSSGHEQADLVAEAVGTARRAEPDLIIEGEIQFDAAIDPEIRNRKAPDSILDGLPNVFIFPNLASANIGYKIAERVGGMTAVGPVLQGLRSPANDLSRGCSAADIVNLIAITSVQARRQPPEPVT